MRSSYSGVDPEHGRLIPSFCEHPSRCFSRCLGWRSKMRTASRNRSGIALYVGCFLLSMSLSAFACISFVMSARVVGPDPARAEPRIKQSRPSTAVRPAVRAVATADASAARRAASPTIISSLDSASAVADVAVSGLTPVAEGRDADDDASSEPWVAPQGTYRTVCVRLCDGSFVPMSFSTTRDRFKADAVRCERSCGAPSRLFIGRPDVPMDDFVDIRGRRYADLPSAFLFRVTFDAGCSCRGPRVAPAESTASAPEATKPAGVPWRLETAAIATAPSAVPSVRRAAPARHAGEDRFSGLHGGNQGQASGSVADERLGKATPQAVVDPSVAGLKPSNGARAEGAPAARPGTKARGRKVAGLSGDRSKAVKEKVFASRNDASAAQRSFSSGDYWRVSYWHAPD